MNKVHNPILKGFYPDPSICRVEDTYYLVTSTFTYFPGVPIFSSKDFVHWNQIGNVLDRESQIPLTNGGHSMGIFAPTIRFYEGLFYMITTNVGNGGNFVVTAENPEGPWSEPYYLKAEGIDPSLFFNEDGTCYFCGTKGRREGSKFYGDNEIFIQEFDYHKMELVGESYPIWHGALKDACWPEGPHIYKKDGWYYLLISEGGTGKNHALTIARSKNIMSDFEGHKANPILTHRHLGEQFPIMNVGHGDLIETSEGEWWIVLLGSRPYGGYYRNLGRETFLARVVWENDWPVVNPGIGMVTFEVDRPRLPMQPATPVPEKEEFLTEKLPYYFMYSRNPDPSKYSMTDRPGYMRLYMATRPLYGLKSPTMICRRQQEMNYLTETKVEFSPQNGEKAGLVLFQSNEFYYSLGITRKDEFLTVELVKCEQGIEHVVSIKKIENEQTSFKLRIHANEQELRFYVKTNGTYDQIGECQDARILSTDVAGGFVGTCIGFFVTALEKSDNYADFDWFLLS